MITIMIGLVATILFYASLAFLGVLLIKGFFRYRKATVYWRGRPHTLLYYIDEEVVPGGVKYRYNFTDRILFYRTFDSHLYANIEKGRVTYVGSMGCVSNWRTRRSWLLEFLLKMPKPMDSDTAFRLSRQHRGTADEGHAIFTDLLNPENRLVMGLIMQLPKPRSAQSSEDLIQGLPQRPDGPA